MLDEEQKILQMKEAIDSCISSLTNFPHRFYFIISVRLCVDDGLWKFFIFLSQKRLLGCACYTDAMEVEFLGDFLMLEPGKHLSSVLHLPDAYIFFLISVCIHEHWEKIKLFEVWTAFETLCSGFHNFSHLGCRYWLVPFDPFPLLRESADSWGDEWSDVGMVLSDYA